MECSKIVYEWIKQTEKKVKKSIPLTLTLFGGYRRDSFESVLSLHTADLVMRLNILCGADIDYQPIIKQKEYGKYWNWTTEFD